MAKLDPGQLPVLVLGAGCGGIKELQEHIDASAVQWALLQFCVGEGTLKRQRMLFLHVNGQDCPPLARGRANELTASVQQWLREGTGGTGTGVEAFHASVEVKTPEEVTVEGLLERVLPFFVVDHQDYSVQWLQSHYDRQLQEAQSPAAPDAPPEAVRRSTVGESSAKRGTVFEMGSTSFESGRDALKAVAESMGAWNWVFFRATEHVVAVEDLSVVAGGIGSVEEMQSCYEEHPQDVLFGLLRMGFGQGRLRRTKYVFIHAIGDQVPAVARGKRSAQRPKMEELMGSYASISVTMELLTTSDLTLKSVVDRVRRAVVVDDDVLDRDKATVSVFSMEAFQQALQEEKRSRMDELRAQRKLRMEQSEATREGSAYSERSVSSMVSLLRSDREALNWLLLGPDPAWLQVRRGTSGYAKTEQLVVPGSPGSVGDSTVLPSPKSPWPSPEPSPSAPPETPEKAPTDDADVADVAAVADVADVADAATPRPSLSLDVLHSTVRFSGPLLKRSGAWHGFWQLRWFQVRGGSLMWWASPELVAQEPAGALLLRDMKVQRKGATQFTLECAFGKKKVYTLESDVFSSCEEANWRSDRGRAWPRAEQWVKALEEESILHPTMSVEGDALAVAGKDLLRSLFA